MSRQKSKRNTQTGQLDTHVLLRQRYLIVRAIGRGGMAAVYEARDTRNGTSCAIKEMSLSTVPANERSQAIQNFLAEARILSRLKHPNMPAFTDFFTEGTRYFLVMEFIDGKTLEELLEANNGPFSERRVLGWARQLCDVLEYLHSQQPPIIFRDLKPGNIMLTPGGRIKLIDFGIARMLRHTGSQDTQLLGTPGFAPPEQYGSAQTDERSDIYSLAMTLAQLMTDTVNNTGFGLNDVHFTYPHISPPVARVLEKATSLKPDDRYESVMVFRRALLGIGTFRFENGGEATTPDELADLCSHYREEAVAYLFESEIESWLLEIGQDEMARATKRLRMIAGDHEIVVEKLIKILLGVSLPQPYKEEFIYLEPEDGWTEVRERLKAARAGSIILVVSTRAPLRSPAGWKLVEADMRLSGQKLTVISLDRQIRAVARAAGLSIAESLSDFQQSKAYSFLEKSRPTSLRKGANESVPNTALIKRSRRFPGRPQQPRSISGEKKNRETFPQGPLPEKKELQRGTTISLFTDKDVSTPINYTTFKDLPTPPQNRQIQSAQKTKILLLRSYRVFLCYAREDEKLLNQLSKHLKALQRQRYIEPWYDRAISAGSDWKKDIDEHLKTADIILLLVSPDFMASDYCYSVEVENAMNRHNNGEAIVIPIILRHTYWNGALFGDLQALPEDAKPIFGPDYPYPDKAFLEVIEGILEAIKYLESKNMEGSKGEKTTLYANKDFAETNEQQRRHTWGEEK